ncbi:MAG: acyltransferase family protein [Clostridiaceae bacterium]|nr:acyltransferase family protein [Oscillospiraceae bacterium]NLO63236.1 acyltransferase family protein [Clostridiaceae bacterium]
MRRNDIDNLRSLCILMLFVYHTFMIYNHYGESFYVRGDSMPLLGGFLVATSPWFMPLLFAIAGISTRCALKKRSVKLYIVERVKRLFVPLIFGILVLIPIQTYYAERFHNGYSGGYFEQYLLFFTKWTDLTGYEGGFTPGHLWFILYLFVISLAAIPLILLARKYSLTSKINNLNMPALLAFAAILWLFAPLLVIGGKGLGENFALFMLGYFVLAEEKVQERIEKYWPILTGALVAMLALHLILVDRVDYQAIPYELYRRVVTWVGILALLGLGRRFLNFRTRITAYFAAAAFPVYLLHQSVLVAVAFYVTQRVSDEYAQAGLIILLSFVVTMSVYEIIRRVPGLRFCFGIKKRPIE